MGSNEAAERARRKAHEYEKRYGGCAQAVLGAVQEELGIGSKESFKAASALAAGIARQGETCGALVGALCALGLVVGRERIEDASVYRAAMVPAARLTAAFRAEMRKGFGLKDELQNTLCRHIHQLIYGRSFNLSNDEGLRAFLDAGGHGDDGCPKVCGIAARVAAEELSLVREKSR